VRAYAPQDTRHEGGSVDIIATAVTIFVCDFEEPIALDPPTPFVADSYSPPPAIPKIDDLVRTG